LKNHRLQQATAYVKKNFGNLNVDHYDQLLYK